MAANQNVTQLTQQTVSANTTSLFYAVTSGTTDTGLPFSVFVNNLGLTGVPTVPTATPGTNTTQIASTAFVVASYAPLASPTFTGVPAAPTATNGTNTTQIATTAYVVTYAAPLASPTFTGTPTLPTGTIAVTQTTGNSSTAVATTAFVANTFAAPPSYGATTPAAVHATTIGATGLITPTSSIGIAGTTTNDNAQAGSIGEFPTPTNLTAVSLTTATATNLSSVSLTAGDYEVSGLVIYIPAGTSTVSGYATGISTTSATLGPNGTTASLNATLTTGAQQNSVTPTVRISLASTTTVYLVGFFVFGVSTATANGYLHIRRVR